MKIYTGRRDKNGNCVVRVLEDGDSRALKKRLDLFNHSPTGFSWGYGGSGPAQLALALIADALGDDDIAVRLHQKFKFKVVGNLPRDTPWRLTQAQVLEKLRDLCEVT
jgi:hypothetical protein